MQLLVLPKGVSGSTLCEISSIASMLSLDPTIRKIAADCVSGGSGLLKQDHASNTGGQVYPQDLQPLAIL